MPVNITNITNYITNGELWAGFTVPASGPLTISPAGVPAGDGAFNLGATQGEMVGVYTPDVQGVDVEQLYGQVGHFLANETAMVRATLVEPNMRNLELVASQGTRANYLDNGSFEGTAVGGLADGWQSVGTISAPSLSLVAPQLAYGQSAQQFTTAAAPGGVQTAKLTNSAFQVGRILVLSAYAKALAATPNLTLKLEAFDAAGLTLGTQSAIQALTTAYSRGSVAFTLPANTVTVQATLHDATGQAATWTLDNAQLEVVASGSTATAVVGPKMLTFGGRLDTLTYPIALIGQIPGTTRYTWWALYSAYATGGLQLRKQRTSATAIAVEFTGCPVPTRTPGDFYGQYGEHQAA